MSWEERRARGRESIEGRRSYLREEAIREGVADIEGYIEAILERDYGPFDVNDMPEGL